MEIENKIVQGLERISDVFKTLLLEKAKEHNISPIQIQILLYINAHARELCGVTQLAKEFNLTKPTISDAVKSLHHKELVEKDYSSSDSRSYTLFLTAKGETLINDLETYSNPILQLLKEGNQSSLDLVYESITNLIYRLNQKGVIKVQRTCFGCKFYSRSNSGHFCNLMSKPLAQSAIRLDCAEFEKK